MTRATGRDRRPKADMDAARVLDVLRCLERRGAVVWLDGGWAVDALLGEQTRPHDDLDLVASLEDVASIHESLKERGYALAGGGAPGSVELVDAAGHQVDVHPVSFTDTGDGLYRMASGEHWVYPAEGFAGAGQILSCQVRCLTAEVMMVCHSTGYALDETHRRDAAALSERFAIPVPDYRSGD